MLGFCAGRGRSPSCKLLRRDEDRIALVRGPTKRVQNPFVLRGSKCNGLWNCRVRGSRWRAQFEELTFISSGRFSVMGGIRRSDANCGSVYMYSISIDCSVANSFGKSTTIFGHFGIC